MTEWRSVPGHENAYEVSSDGQMRRTVAVGRHNCHKPGLLSLSPNNKGYLYAQIGGKKVYAHIAVASAFLGIAPEGYEVNHIDGVHDHNWVKNLEWITHSGNIVHAIRSLGGKQAKITIEIADEIRDEYARGNVSLSAIARNRGLSGTQVGNIVKGLQWVREGIVVPEIKQGRRKNV